MEIVEQLLSQEFYIQFIEQLGVFKFIAGILLAMVEALFPPLPLALFVTVNVIAYGAVLGTIYSYIGTVIGSFLVFLIIRKYGTNYIHKHAEEHEKTMSVLHWIHDKGAMPIVLLYTFPFTPSILLSGLAAVSEIKPTKFLVVLLAGKLFMIISLSVIGTNVQSFTENPIRSLLYIGGVLGISFIAKQLISKYEKSVLRERMHRKRKCKEEK